MCAWNVIDVTQAYFHTNLQIENKNSIDSRQNRCRIEFPMRQYQINKDTLKAKKKQKWYWHVLTLYGFLLTLLSSSITMAVLLSFSSNDFDVRKCIYFMSRMGCVVCSRTRFSIKWKLFFHRSHSFYIRFQLKLYHWYHNHHQINSINDEFAQKLCITIVINKQKWFDRSHPFSLVAANTMRASTNTQICNGNDKLQQ